MAEQPVLEFAGVLRELRARAQLTQEELAEAAGLSPRSVSDLERGINRTARKDTAVLLAGALGLAEPARSSFIAAALGRVRAAEVLAAVEEPGPGQAGAMPRVWNIPARNPGFTGRDDLLAQVRDRLLAGGAAVVQALHGMGGVGKTQLAAEYAHRFATSYELAWWVNAEQGGLIGDQVADLGVTLGCIDAGAEMATVRAVVLAELRARSRWLLIFDNAEDSAEVAPWLPGGNGHVLITSREPGWAELAAPVEVDVLARSESVALLQARVTGLGEADADRLAAGMGDLPLALAQAGAFMASTGMTAGEYLELLRTRAGPLLDQAAPGSYPRSLAAATALTAARLADDDPAAAELASLCAFLAPDPVPEELFTGAAGVLPGGLAARAADPLAWRQTLAQITRRSLARVDHRGLVMHRLTQAILRDRLTPAQAAATRNQAETILVGSDPGDPDDPATWPRWARLMPHLLAANLAGTGNPGLRQLACHGCRYLLARGDTRTAFGLAGDLRQRWRDRLGADHEHTLALGDYLGWALTGMGRLAEARDLARDVLDRRRRILGQDHPDTLSAANDLATNLSLLGEMAGRGLARDTLDRFRQVLGKDHPETLDSADHLGVVLHAMGELQAARDLHQDTLDRLRRVVGEDHPETLACANNLGNDLYALGELQDARDLHQDVLDRRRQILGQDHPSTLTTADNLAADLRAQGKIQAARDLHQDTLDRRRRILGENHPATLASADNLAADLRALGEQDKDT